MQEFTSPSPEWETQRFNSDYEGHPDGVGEEQALQTSLKVRLTSGKHCKGIIYLRMITFYPHFLSFLQAGRGWRAAAGRGGTGMVLQPVLTKRQLWQRSHGPSSSTPAASCCHQGARNILTYRWVQMGKERSCASPPGATSLWEPSFPPLFRRGSSACDYNEAGEVGSRARSGASLCCHRLQQVQHSLLYLFLMSLQWEKLPPLGKQQKENVQGRLMSRFSLSGTRALSQIPSSLRAQITFKRQI